MAGNGVVNLSWPVPAPGAAPINYYMIHRSTSAGAETYFTYNYGTTLSDTTVTNGTQYFYKVSAVNGYGEGAKSNEASATPAVAAQVASAPVVTATRGNTTVALSWPAPANNGSPITSYKIYRSTSTGTETFLNSTATTSFNDTGLTNGTTYFYKVSAVNGIGEGPQSAEVSATPATTPGTPVVSRTAGNASVSLSWPAPANGGSAITSYKIYRSTTTGTETLLTSTASTSFNDTGLTNGTTYFYKVSAVNAVGEGSQSAEVSATPVAAPAAPVVSATRGNTTVALSWPAPASNGSAITGYKVYRSTSVGNEVLLPGPLVGPNSFNDTGLTNGTSYFYKVSAVNAIGEGSQSAEVSAVPATTPGTPVPVATAGNASVSLSWPAPNIGGSAITSYKVYRSTTAGGESFLNSTAPGRSPTPTVSNGTQYFYKVSAVNAVGEGTLSGEVSATPSCRPPRFRRRR